MTPTPTSRLIAIVLVSGLAGHTVGILFGSRGEPLPMAGPLPGIALLGLAGFLLWAGLKVKRYLDESRERQDTHTLAPRQYQLDMMQAYRTIMAARAGAYAGAISAGVFGGQCAYAALGGGGTLFGAIIPTGFSSLAGLALAVVGIVVQRWGTLPPPHDGGAKSASEPA